LKARSARGPRFEPLVDQALDRTRRKHAPLVRQAPDGGHLVAGETHVEDDLDIGIGLADLDRLELGLRGVEPPTPATPVTVDDLGVVCWMAVLPPAP
jgi:hypothetical protein